MTTVVESLNQSLHQLMKADARVILLGEDILDPYGGAFKVTRGLSSQFPDRVFTTPISEAAIVGMASGLALRGLLPIVEIMFGDFLFLAGDQLVNHAAKFQSMYNDTVRVPLVVRTPMGGRRGYGPTHSQSIEKHFMGVPGLWLVAPSMLISPGDLLHQATVECDSPVVFIENKTCYGRPLVSDVPGMTRSVIAEASSPFPTVHLRHERSSEPDALMWCYGGMAPHCLDAVQLLRDREGLFVDLAVISQLSPVPSLHLRRVIAAGPSPVHVYVEEASVEHGWAAELLAQVHEQTAQESETVVKHRRIGAVHSPIPSSRELERQCLPQVDDIVQQVLECF